MTAPKHLAGSRVLVTGATGAFGAAVMTALRTRGAETCGLDLQSTEHVIGCDITDPAAVTDGVQAAVEHLGGLDLLIHCAGIGDLVDAGAPPDETCRKIVEVNLWGAWRVTAAALPSMLASRGRVIFVASGLAYATMPFAAPYAVSKRAVTAYADALRLEYGTQVDVTTVYPGYVATAIHASSEMAGVSLGALTSEEQISHVVRTLLRAATAARPPRDCGTSVLGHLDLLAAKHLPRVADRVIVRRFRAAARSGRYDRVPIAQALLQRLADHTSPEESNQPAAGASTAES